MSKKITTYEQAWRVKPDGRTQNQIFEDLVKDVKKDHPNISDTDARQAARNLITYVKEIMKIAQDM